MNKPFEVIFYQTAAEPEGYYKGFVKNLKVSTEFIDVHGPSLLHRKVSVIPTHKTVELEMINLQPYPELKKNESPNLIVQSSDPVLITHLGKLRNIRLDSSFYPFSGEVAASAGFEFLEVFTDWDLACAAEMQRRMEEV